MGEQPGSPSPGAPLPLGVIGRPHGVRGELVFRTYNPDGVQLFDLDLPLMVELRGPGQAREPARLVSARPSGDGALVAFDGIRDRDLAARFTNRELCVDRSLLPPLEEDEFYLSDLSGCQVHDLQGRFRGVVEGTFWNGSQDVLTIREPGGGELLIPAVPEFVHQVDVAGRKLVIDDHE